MAMRVTPELPVTRAVFSHLLRLVQSMTVVLSINKKKYELISLHLGYYKSR